MNSFLILLGNMCGTTATTEEAGATSSGSSIVYTIVMFALIILIFYFLIFRPQRKRDKEAKAMIAAMKRGDKVVTIGGIHGTIVTVKDKTVIVKVDDTTRLEFSKDAISSVLNKDGSTITPPVKEKKKSENKKEEKKEDEAIVDENKEEKSAEPSQVELSKEEAPSEENNENVKPFKMEEEQKEDK